MSLETSPSFATIVRAPETTSTSAVVPSGNVGVVILRADGALMVRLSVCVADCVGIAESAGCRDLPSLLARADLAMYEAKRAGGGCYRVFQGAEMAPDAVLPAG